MKNVGDKYFLDSPLALLPPLLSTIEISSIDVILISNYFNILSLPYIISSGFKGQIIATEPTLNLGK